MTQLSHRWNHSQWAGQIATSLARASRADTAAIVTFNTTDFPAPT